MIGVALEGGGLRGAYQVGALKAIEESGIKINGLVGTSIGAVNSALYLIGGIKLLESFWKDEDFATLLGDYVHSDVDSCSIIDELKDYRDSINGIIKNHGLDVDQLENKLKSILNEKKIRNSNCDYGLITYRIKDKTALSLFKEDIPQGKLADYITASCYLPIFKMKKLDGDSYYLDGGFYENSPSNMLSEKGYEKIFVIGLKAPGINRKKIDNSKIVKIMPSRNLGHILNVNKNNIIRNINMGYYDTLKVLNKYDGIKYTFKKYPKWVYKFLLRKVDKKTMQRAEIFFLTGNKKILIIKTLEFIMNKEDYDFNKVYSPIKLIKKYRKNKENKIAYKFIKKLKFL